MRILDQLVAEARERVDRQRELVAEQELLASPPELAEGAFVAAFAGPGVSVIAELKRASPSAGEIRPKADVAEIGRAYERGGAVALSVLTEERHFGGSLDDLRAVRAATGLPILRKDFIVDPYQLAEAAAAGADAVLLIVAAVEDDDLRLLDRRAAELGLDRLVEVHDERELERALALDPGLIGINNRDLGDFSVDLELTERLIAMIPERITVVAESGYETREQLAELERLGARGALIGEALMRSGDPEAMLSDLLAPEGRPERPG